MRIAAASGQAGGNIAQELAAVWLMDFDREEPQGSNPQASEAYITEAGDIVCERYPVYGDTTEELQRAVTDLENGTGPLAKEEGKRYAAYVTADYTVEFIPRIVAYSVSDGEVEVELGARGEVQRTIHMCLPEFHTSNPELACICGAEEARLEDHEMEHVRIFRLCAETLEDSLSEIRATGHGPNLWIAMMSARQELGEAVGRELDETVELADRMNIAIDVLTNHGLWVGPMRPETEGRA
jgi:predicted secreted Zn-dependent protease